MKKVVMRALNLSPIWALVGFADWIYDLISGKQSNDSLYLVLGILAVTLAINYVFFGRLTLWHNQDKEKLESNE